MNYFEKHIGDYISDTVSLSMLEDGAYNRLMDQCYKTERPLPSDRKMIYRLVRAGSPADRKAVDFVLDTFFTQTNEGYIQKRIQAEIERYQDKQRKAKASADARWNKPKPNANGYADASKPHDASDMRTHDERNAHQAPSTRHQTPDTNQKPLSASDDSTGVGAGNSESARSSPGEISKAMRDCGVMSQPADPRLIALSEQGVSVDTVRAACQEAKAAKPNESVGPGYVLAILKRWATDAAAVSVQGAKAPAEKPQREDWTWKKSNAGIDAKGRELGMFPRGGESYSDFTARIDAALEQRKGSTP